MRTHKDNNMNSIEPIWNEYHNKLLYFIQNRIQNKSFAEDILQEVFIKIHTKINTLKDSNKIQNWVFQITRNAIIDHHRKQKETEELSEEVNEEEWAFDDRDRKEMSSCITSLLQSLPENYRDALIMSEIDGLKQKEVAEKQNVSLPNAKIRIQRGRTMLKDLLMEGCTFEYDRHGRVVDYKEEGGKCKPC